MEHLELVSYGFDIKEQDIRSIADLVTDTDVRWNNRDAKAFSELFLDDADFQGQSEPRIDGKAAIERWWGQEVFPGMPEGMRHIATLTRIRFIRDDVAIGDGRVKVIELAGAHEQPRVHLDLQAIVIVEKQDDRWRFSVIRLMPFVPT